MTSEPQPAAPPPRTQTLKAQSAKFALTGVIAAVVDLGLTWLLQIALGLMSDFGARTVGFTVGTATAYVLNRRWTFRAAPSWRRFVAVTLTYVATYAINIFLYRRSFALFDEHLLGPSTVALVAAFLLSQGTATVLNFVVQRWVIFRRTRRYYELAAEE